MAKDRLSGTSAPTGLTRFRITRPRFRRKKAGTGLFRPATPAGWTRFDPPWVRKEDGGMDSLFSTTEEAAMVQNHATRGRMRRRRRRSKEDHK